MRKRRQAPDDLGLISLFSGAGGLDLGFEKARFGSSRFRVIWANEYDKAVLPTFKRNFPHTHLVPSSITDIGVSDLKDRHGRSLISKTEQTIHGILGGPPCQSWSEAGSRRGVKDKRGQLFFEYIRILRLVQPAFFVAENVSGILFERNREALEGILKLFQSAGYTVRYGLVNAKDFGVPQDRERVFFVGIRADLGISFSFPKPKKSRPVTLRRAIADLETTARVFSASSRQPQQNEYAPGGFSPIYMSRNRVRSWDETSFTIQAMARNAPIHPSAPRMIHKGKDRWDFAHGGNERRLTVRECARIQTFPDTFAFEYKNISDGYKMVGNAVPVTLAKAFAEELLSQLSDPNVRKKMSRPLQAKSKKRAGKPMLIKGEDPRTK
jgi:DNA (cytosine-5)-methyltransferase 1